MMKNHITVDNEFGEVFAVCQNQNGKMKMVDLKPNGQNIKVSDQNKQEWLKLM